MNLVLYYSPTRAVVFILASLIWSAVQLQQGTERLGVRLALPIALILYCIPRLKRRHLVFANGTLTVFAGFGPKTRTYSYSNLKEFFIEKNRLFQRGEGQRRIPITEAWAVKSSDWKLLQERLNTQEKKGNPFR